MEIKNKKIIAIAEKDKSEKIEQILLSINPDFKSQVIFFEPARILKIKDLPEQENFILVFNGDQENVLNLLAELNFEKTSYGFSESSDFMASDVNQTEGGATFKLNYKGNSIPIWLVGNINEEKIYYALAVICIGSSLGMNVLEIAEKLKK
jgi:UDP-N-acetylmuramyl pentapeptide synthase